ncbi:MAG TPA: hypothetical protein VGW39_01665 [Chthoniobacterales bacterium]|nr:hypothetical protein [Chthoniobacterales bacterium]
MPPLNRPIAAAYFVFSWLLACNAFAKVERDVSVLEAKIIVREDSIGMYWALTSLPTEDDIKVADPSLRAALKKALKALGQQNVEEWNFKHRAAGNFKTELQAKLPDRYNFTLKSPSTPTPASARGAQRIELKATFKGGLELPVVSKKGLAIHIVVTGSKVISQSPVRTTLGNLAANEVAGLTDLSSEDKAISVSVADSKSPGSESEWNGSREHIHAYEVAALAFASAKKHALQEQEPNQGDASTQVVGEVRDGVERTFQLSSEWETVPSEEAKELLIFEGTQWVLTIPLHAIEEVKFQFSAIQTEGKEIPWDRYPYARQLADNKARAEDQVEQKNEEEFANLGGRLLTAEELRDQTKSILKQLERNRNVLHASGPGSEGHDLVFSGVWLPRETEFTAGVGYSTDKGFGGTIGLTSRNLPLMKNSLLNFNVEAGTETQAGHFSFALPDYYKSADGRWSSQLELTADYKRDQDQKLGMPEQPGVDEERLTAALKNVLRFAATPAAASGRSGDKPGTWAYNASLETTLGYSDTQFASDRERAREEQEGSFLFALADLQQRGWREFRKADAPGIGKVEMLWQLRVKKGFTAGLGDFDFLTTGTRASFTLYFGNESSRDYFVRVLGGGVLNSGNTPVIEQFRLGGDATVRGLEEGERIAEDVVYGSVEGGVRAGRIWQWISRARERGPATPPATKSDKPLPEVGGFDLGNSYVALFYDRAYITQSPPLIGVDRLPSNLESIGAAVEIPLPASSVQGRLRIGYAWSPQSIHERGRSFVSVALDFP